MSAALPRTPIRRHSPSAPSIPPIAGGSTANDFRARQCRAVAARRERQEALSRYQGHLLGRTLGQVKAVDDVSFTIRAGETLGLVGEFGCGKTTTSRLILNLETPTEGGVLLEGQPIHGLEGEALTAFRGKVQAVFQDPWSSLDPRMTVGRTIAESLIVAGWERSRIAARVEELLRQVRLEPAHAQLYPHEFSGGQRQRVALAAALASRPQADRARRAHLGARRVDPGTDDEPPEGHPGAGQCRLSARRA